MWPATPAHHPPCRHASASKGKAGKPVAAPKPMVIRSGIETRVFTHSDVPDVSFWRTHVPVIGVQGLTAAQCHEAATLYCDGTSHRNLAWAKRLVASHPLVTPYTLHYLGAILTNDRATHDLGFNMLVTAHELDYIPSTLQLVLLLEAAHPVATRPPSFRPIPPFRSALAKHAALVRAGRDPSALALQAHLLSTKGDQRGAADLFSRAYRAATITTSSSPSPSPSPASTATQPLSPPRKPKWLLEGTTVLVHGQRLLREGRASEAEACARTAALELDQPQGYAALAKIAADGDERAEYTLRAAMAGIRSACQGMARLEAEAAARAGSEAERRMRGLMSREWSVLGGE